jgi:uncharacterized protein
MEGVSLCESEWQPIWSDPAAAQAMRPIYLLEAEEITPEEEKLIKTPAQRHALAEQIEASVATIYRYWQPLREAIHERRMATTILRQHPKIGRNDPCPCGSGKKFKRCCGVATDLH